MSEIIQPASADDVVETLNWGLERKTTFEVMGRGSKLGLGHAVDAEYVLDLSKLSGVDFYQPEELVLSASPATPMDEIKALLSTNRQQLAFEPPDLSAHLGKKPDAGTLGGVLACDLAGPRRIKMGSARDHFLGFDAVSGRAEIFKSGGRVMKNVSGFDLSKLMAGSLGTLAVMTRVIVKTMPVAEKTRTVLIGFKSGETKAGIQCLMDALGSPHDVSGAAFVPEKLTKRCSVELVKNAGCGVAALRIEGPPSSVEFRCRAIRESCPDAVFVEELHSVNSGKFWQEVRDVTMLNPEFYGADTNQMLWRISVPPSGAAAVAGRISEKISGDVFHDWGGGLLWLKCPCDDTGNADAADWLRAVVNDVKGHATLMSAPETVKQSVPVFHPAAAPMARLAKNIRNAFDPEGLLNPGRMGT